MLVLMAMFGAVDEQQRNSELSRVYARGLGASRVVGIIIRYYQYFSVGCVSIVIPQYGTPKPYSNYEGPCAISILLCRSTSSRTKSAGCSGHDDAKRCFYAST